MPEEDAARTFECQVEDYTKSETHRHEQLKKFMEECKDIIVMGGYGERLAVKHGCLHVHRGHSGDIILEPGIHGIKKIIWVLLVGDISLTALHWIRREQITLMVFNEYGRSYNMIEPSGELRINRYCLHKRQYTISDDEQLGYSRYILKGKFLAQAEILKKYTGVLTQAAEKVAKIENWLTLKSIDELQGREEILLKEKEVDRIYLDAWERFPINWFKDDKVPDLWRICTKRDNPSHASEIQAHCPIDAMFNFAYAVLAIRIELACEAHDLEVNCGFLHIGQTDGASLVYDLIEPVRTQVDELLLSYLLENSLHAGDFIIETTGIVKLAPHFAKIFAAYIVNGLENAALHKIVDEYCVFLRAGM